MTNPNNAIGTNAAFGGRTSVNAFNDGLAGYTRGILSGWACAPNLGLTVALGGDGNVRDVAIAADNAGNKITINNISGSPVSVTMGAAPVSNSRIDAIVAYVDNPANGSATETDNPGACGIIAVAGTPATSPVAPNDSAIRQAIVADGASGANAYYVVLATVRIVSGTTDITANMITVGNYAKITGQNIDLSPAYNLDYSTTEINTGAKWIDGRAIYKKTINCGTLPNATDKIIEHGVDNLSRVIYAHGYAFRSSDGTGFPLIFTSNIAAANSIGFTWNSTTIVIGTGTDRSNITESYITIYYVKTS